MTTIARTSTTSGGYFRLQSFPLLAGRGTATVAMDFSSLS
jgi:hypothetical protein